MLLARFSSKLLMSNPSWLKKLSPGELRLMHDLADVVKRTALGGKQNTMTAEIRQGGRTARQKQHHFDEWRRQYAFKARLKEYESGMVCGLDNKTFNIYPYSSFDEAAAVLTLGKLAPRNYAKRSSIFWAFKEASSRSRGLPNA
jgi:hypothetical protein